MRPKSFNEDDVLRTIEETFRRVGYDGASLDVLTRATGLNRSSLYNAFGCKNDMMRRAVANYTERSCDTAARMLKMRPLREGLRAFFLACVEPGLQGCLLGNLVAERAEAEAQDRAFLAARMTEVEAAVATALDVAAVEGEIAPSADAASLARYVMATAQGLRILSLARPDATLFEGVIDTALDAFPFADAAA
jgi:TetR/AcrR family transcriptional repressor of nem operon